MRISVINDAAVAVVNDAAVEVISVAAVVYNAVVAVVNVAAASVVHAASMLLQLHLSTRKSAMRGTYTPGWCVINFDL